MGVDEERNEKDGVAVVPFLAKLPLAISESFATSVHKVYGEAGRHFVKNAPKEGDFLIEAFAVPELHKFRRTTVTSQQKQKQVPWVRSREAWAACKE